MTLLVTHPGETGATLAALEPLQRPSRPWPALLGAALTIGMVIGLANALLGRGLGALGHAVPTDPRFYLCFILFYFALPVGDFLIFRRLWGIPLSGLAALAKKRIANDLIVNYTGEAYFYSWARTHARALVAAPFGAIKDVSILSAVATNALTLAMLAVALPFGRNLMTPDQFHRGLWSTGVLIAISLPFLIFSRRVFALPRRELWIVFGIHGARVIASATLIALAWHFALPEVSVGMWLLLAAGRLLVSRLPLMSSLQKDIAFVGFAALLIGQHDAIRQLLGLLAALTLVANAVLVVAFGLHALIKREKPW